MESRRKKSWRLSYLFLTMSKKIYVSRVECHHQRAQCADIVLGASERGAQINLDFSSFRSKIDRRGVKSASRQQKRTSIIVRRRAATATNHTVWMSRNSRRRPSADWRTVRRYVKRSHYIRDVCTRCNARLRKGSHVVLLVSDKLILSWLYAPSIANTNSSAWNLLSEGSIITTFY